MFFQFTFMKYLTLIISICLPFFISCQYYAIKTYKIHRKCPFEKKHDYELFIQKDAVLQDCNMLVLNESSFSSFYTERLQKNGSSIYIGAFVNDSIMIKNSTYLMEKPDCSHRITEVINEISNRIIFPDTLLTKTKKISSYDMIQIHKSDNQQLENPEAKIKIYLSYSYAYGNYYYALYKKINAICRQSHYKIELYLISLDPYYRWK